MALNDRPVDVVGQETVSPEVGLMSADRDTVPWKLLTLVRLTRILEPVTPALKSTWVWTLIWKSPTWTIVRDRWDAVPG